MVAGVNDPLKKEYKLMDRRRKWMMRYKAETGKRDGIVFSKTERFFLC